MGNYQRKDHLYLKAKSEGYRSRAAYKLQELDQKYHLIKPGMKVVDLGCAPGGWLQVAAAKVGRLGMVIGIDRLVVKSFRLGEIKGREGEINSPIILTGDITDVEIQQQVIKEAGSKVDLILSDMSPDLTGVYFQDAARSAELVEIAFTIANILLKPKGNIVTKIFPGTESDQLFLEMKKNYKKLSRVALKSTRKTSKEFYFVGEGFVGEE